MKNFIQNGDVMTFAAPYDVLSGAGFQVGVAFAVANYDALNTTNVEGSITGVFQLVKATGAAWAVGDKIYWDNTAKNCTKTVTISGTPQTTATVNTGDTDYSASAGVGGVVSTAGNPGRIVITY